MRYLLIFVLLFSAAQAQQINTNPKGLRVVYSTLGVRISTVPDTTSTIPGQPVGFTYTLDTSSVTSAGVFTSDGTLIRTLWSNIRQDAAIYNNSWDGEKDSLGVQAPAGTYTIKIVSNNIDYVWEGGRIGNTSTDIAGSTRYRSHSGSVYDMAFVGSKIFTAKGSNEMNPTTDLIDSSDYGRKTNIFQYGDFQTNLGTTKICTDGVRVYASGFDGFGTTCATFAFNASDYSYYTFTSGINVKCAIGITYSCPVDTMMKLSAYQIATAVQKNGNFLFHAWSNDKLNVSHKLTGATVRSNTITGLASIAISGYNTMWIATNSNITRYTINADGSFTSLGTVISAGNTIAMSVSDDSATLIVSNSSTMQVKAYNNTTGAALWTLGQSGGYSANSTVADDKFAFYGPQFTNLKFAPNGTFWVGDPGNYRALHFSSTRQHLNTIQLLGNNYSCAVDVNNPSRVFAGVLEFKVDSSKPYDQSWSLAANWQENYKDTKWYNNLSVFPLVVTLSNGKTYTTVTPPSNDTTAIVELVANGTLRFTGVRTPNVAYRLLPNGDLGLVNEQGGNLVWIRKPLTGFTSDNPVYGNDVIDATIPYKITDPVSGAYHPYQKTAGGRFYLYYQGKIQGSYGAGYHFGIVNEARNKFSALTSQATAAGYEGQFPGNGWFDIDNGSTTMGSNAASVGETTVEGYYGEFWKASQVNKYNHRDINGLMLGQFGVAGPDVAGQEAAAKMAGNALIMTTTFTNGKWYLYHGDESYHSGTHRWRFDRLNTIQYQNSTIVKTADAPPQVVKLAVPLISNVNPGANWTFTPSMTSISAYSIASDVRHPALRVFVFGTEGTKASAKRTTTFNSPAIDSFVLTGNILYQGQDLTRSSADSSNFEILDNNNRVIFRLYREYIGGNTVVKFNGTTIINAEFNTVVRKMKYPTKFRIVGTIETISLQLDDGTNYVLAPVNSLANPLYPKTIQMSFTTGGIVNYHDMALQDLEILKK